jgi:hypothetical protein
MPMLMAGSWANKPGIEKISSVRAKPQIRKRLDWGACGSKIKSSLFLWRGCGSAFSRYA